MVACVEPAAVPAVVDAAARAGIAVAVVGEAGGDRLVVDGLLDVGLADAVAAWRRRLPDALGAAAPH